MGENCPHCGARRSPRGQGMPQWECGRWTCHPDGPVYSCYRYQLQELRTRLEQAEAELQEAVEAVHTFHGEAGWDIYESNAPEMKRWKAILAAREGK